MDISKPVADASSPEKCPKCGQDMDRVYSFQKSKEFQVYYEELYGTEIGSRKQEEKLMKRHGHIYTHDVLAKKYEREIKGAKWKQRQPVSVRMGK